MVVSFHGWRGVEGIRRIGVGGGQRSRCVGVELSNLRLRMEKETDRGSRPARSEGWPRCTRGSMFQDVFQIIPGGTSNILNIVSEQGGARQPTASIRTR